MTTASTRTYAYYHNHLWDMWSARFRRIIGDHFPDTGGSEHLLHNWYSCGRDEESRLIADTIRAEQWGAWAAIKARMSRELLRANHRDHIAAREQGRYLWCAACEHWRRYGGTGDYLAA